MAYAKELEAEQRPPPLPRAGPGGAPDAEGWATAGYPGAWDDDDVELPRAAAR